MNPNKTMRILIGTPCGGGQASVHYMLSLLETFQNVMGIKHSIFIRNQLRLGAAQGQLTQAQHEMLQKLESENLIDFEIGLYTLSNESLLSRGRNHIAAVAIRQGWDKLFFIDADSKWTFRQFYDIVTAPFEFVAGACPLKILPISLNFLPYQDDENYYEDRIRSMDSLLKMREGHKDKFISVPFVGTAFMCISRKVLLACAESSDEYQYPNPQTGFMHTHWNMFDTRTMHNKFMSEDWSFCERARRLGFDLKLNTDVVISHVGSMMYSPEMAQISHIPKQEMVSQVNPVKVMA